MADVPGRRVGFLGLGLMGSRMARRFLVGGYAVTVFNRRPDKAQPLVKAGASFAGTPKLVAEKSDVILYSLADDAAVRDVGLGVEALAEAVALGRKAGLDTSRMLDALQLAAVVSTARKGKFENVKRSDYPAALALRMMSKITASFSGWRSLTRSPCLPRRRRSKSTLSRTPAAGAARKTSRRSSARSRTCPASANRSPLTVGDGHDRV